MKVIELQNVHRRFKVAKRDGSFWKYMVHRQYTTVEAVNDVSFSIKAGELVGFIGPNGAGKSTAIKMMTGILVPTAGEVRVLGRVPHQHRKTIAAQIGVLFGQRSQLWWDLPVEDTFKLLRKIYKIPDKVYEDNVKTYGALLGVDEFIKQPVRQLSLGQRMRADLCASLLHDPKILFLDEPTIGLDVVVKKQIREMIRDINREKGVTVILTTHDMKDIEEICERIIMIDKGRIIIDQPTDEVKHTFRGNNSIEIVFDDVLTAVEVADAETVEWEADHATVTYDPAKTTSAAIIAQIMQQHKIADITIKEPEIDDIIRNLYQNSNQSV